ncbi:hypothetical protein BJ741DRAFT_591267 [Chytriomyces cf. hyalinus JEL632]|nr:hypothetical protein BJ741DRAFT_591267 [Chytriomyces cf. hyalinus JEL632]
MLSTPTLVKIAPAKGSSSTSTTPTDVTQAKPGPIPLKKRGRPPKNAASGTDGSAPAQPASWTASQVDALLRYRYDTFRSDFLDAKSKEAAAKGWKKVQMSLSVHMDVEYTVEQCKGKVMALKTLWSKLKAEEGETGNNEKRTKKPECFESMVLYFGNKSGLIGETLGDTEDGATMSQSDAQAKFQSFLSDSKSCVARSSSSTVSSSGSLADIDSDTDSVGDTKTPVKRQKLTEKEEADNLTRESFGLPPVGASKQSDSKSAKPEPKPKRVKPDIAGALENMGSRVGDGISELAKAIAGNNQSNPHFKNVESLISQQAVSNEENSKQLKTIADGQQESSKHMKTIADGQQETTKHLKSVADSNARVLQLLENFLLSVGNSSKQQ